MRVESAGAQDIPGIRWLLEYERWSAGFLTEATVGTFLVCRDEIGVAATIRLQILQGSGLLSALVVDPCMRGRGLGGQLARAAERKARRAGVDRVCLLTIAADEFFSARGFRIIALSEAPAWIQSEVNSTEVDVVTAALMLKRLF